MPISRENAECFVTYFVFTSPVLHVNVFCSDLITMVPKWNYFIFMQIDYPRWPPGTVTKNSINTKMTNLRPIG